MKKVICVSLIAVLSVFSLFAGDRAEFVNLGFSSDGSYFMFGFYGYDTDLHQSYAEIYTVDVGKNVFVPKGISKGRYDYVLAPGQSVQGALFALLEDNAEVRTRYAIQYLETGRPIYIRFDDNPMSEENQETEENPGMNSLEFKDFVTGDYYSLTLNQTLTDGSPVSSAFSLDLSVTSSDGLVQSYTIGHPHYQRAHVESYNINRVIVGPDNRSLVIIIAKIYENGNIRYMVETVKLK